MVYYFEPVNLGLPFRFGWGTDISVILSMACIVISLIYLVPALIAAKEETILPKKEHTMYKGIYTKMRHPQTVADFLLFLSIGLLLDSPFLTLIAFVCAPVFFWFCRIEEKDLLIRYPGDYEEYRKKTGMFFPRFK